MAHLEAPDWTVRDEGTIFIFTPQTEAAKDHAVENFPDDCMMWGQGYVVEHRYAGDIIADLAESFVLQEV